MPKTAIDILDSGNLNINPSRRGMTVSADSIDLPYTTRFVKIGNTGGNLVVLYADEANDNAPVTIQVQPGDFLPICIRRVVVGTTAGTIHVGF